MMDAQILRELETAAQILLASPSLVNNSQRLAAENIFLNFKKTQSPYNLCMKILETSKVDYVLFEVAGLLKDALIREWTTLEEFNIISLRQYLLRYLIERPTLPPFVREKILQVIAIMIKRRSIDNFNNGEVLLNEVEQLIMNGTHAQKLLGCSLLAAIIQEYAVTSKSADIGLSFLTHYKAKHLFGIFDLKRIFQFCCTALGSVGSAEPPFLNEDLSMIKHLLAISESVLTWDFASSTLPDRFGYNAEKSNENVNFAPHPFWMDLILDPQLVNLFFTVYWKIRLCPQLSHHGLTCLVQLAGMDRRMCITNGHQQNVDYMDNYLKAFMKLITSVEVLDREALGIASIVKKIFTPSLVSADREMKLYHEFFEQVIALTCNFAEGAANEETICAEDRLYMEAFDLMMEAWMSFLYSSTSSMKDYFKQAFQRIFNAYLKCHISPPDGTRGQGGDLEQEELDESDEIDRVKFKTQLQTIGGFGQHVPEHCLPLLARLLENRTKVLRSHVDKLYHQGPTISDSSALVLLFEDIHWLLLISGNVVFMESDDGIPQIPVQLMKYSLAQSSVTDIDVSLRVFGSPDRDIEDINGADQKTDHILRLVAAVFRLSHVLKKFIEGKLTQFLSPEVISSTLWFLKEWSASYLLPNESLYSEISMPLLYAFGRDSEGGVWTVNYLLEQVVTYFMHFNSEPGVTEDAVKLFISLMDSKEKSACVLKSENLTTIINNQSRLPQKVKRDVYKGLALASIAFQDDSSRNEYWQRILKPLQTRFRLVVRHENLSRIYQEEQTKTEILEVLDCLTGIVSGARSSTAPAIYDYLKPIFPELPGLVGVYRNYQLIVELVFRLFSVCATHLITYLSHTDNRIIYEFCIRTIQMYEKCNSARFALDLENQEETYNDILLMLEMLTNLLPRDYFDLSNLESTLQSEGQGVMPADVCLYGLKTIMPLMTANLFRQPPLCLQYYKFICNLCEMYPEKICQLPECVFKNIFTTIELGLTFYSQDIFPLCCEFLELLSVHMSKTEEGNVLVHETLKTFLKLLIEMTLSRQINSEYLPNAGSALLGLISCYQQEYQSLVQGVLNSQPNPETKEQLKKAFESLTSHITSKYEKQQRLLMNNKFDAFISTINGILFIK